MLFHNRVLVKLIRKLATHLFILILSFYLALLLTKISINQYLHSLLPTALKPSRRGFKDQLFQLLFSN